MKIPMNLVVFAAIAGVFYLGILPKKTKLVSGLMEILGASRHTREDSTRAMVQKRVRVDLCPQADLCEYRAGAWSEYHSDESGSRVEITHSFACDKEERQFLFRLSGGSISEIHNLR